MSFISEVDQECGKNRVPEIYASVKNTLCFINYATNCKHGKKYTNLYDYGEYCSNWINEEIEDMRRRGLEKMAQKASLLKENCISEGELRCSGFDTNFCGINTECATSNARAV